MRRGVLSSPVGQDRAFLFLSLGKHQSRSISKIGFISSSLPFYERACSFFFSLIQCFCAFACRDSSVVEQLFCPSTVLSNLIKFGLEVRDPVNSSRLSSVVEQLFCKQQVVSSSLTGGSQKKAAEFSGINSRSRVRIPVSAHKSSAFTLSWRSSQSHVAVDDTPERAPGVQISHSAH